jgi:hypothetical protein
MSEAEGENWTRAVMGMLTPGTLVVYVKRKENQMYCKNCNREIQWDVMGRQWAHADDGWVDCQAMGQIASPTDEDVRSLEIWEHDRKNKLNMNYPRSLAQILDRTEIMQEMMQKYMDESSDEAIAEMAELVHDALGNAHNIVKMQISMIGDGEV